MRGEARAVETSLSPRDLSVGFCFLIHEPKFMTTVTLHLSFYSLIHSFTQHVLVSTTFQETVVPLFPWLSVEGHAPLSATGWCSVQSQRQPMENSSNRSVGPSSAAVPPLYFSLTPLGKD